MNTLEYIECLFAISALLCNVILTACASTSGGQQRFAVCSYDHAWDAALEAVKDRAIMTKDKDAGMIVTGWLEIPMPGRTFGALQREVGTAKIVPYHPHGQASRRCHQDQLSRRAATMGFRGGSRLFGWASTDPSAEVMNDVQSRLDSKLKEHGCSLN